MDKQASLLDPFVSYEEIEVFKRQLLVPVL
jgi:hypothetical protein